MKLHSRIFLLLLVTLLGLGTASMAFLYSSTKNVVERETAERLKTAQRTFYDMLENQQTFLNRNVETVARDWGLRQAVGSDDRDTLESVLQNHSQRIAADVALFIDTAGMLRATTLAGTQEVPEQLAVQTLAASEGTTQLIAALNGRYYKMVMTSVNAPVRIGWVGMGFAIDDALASHYSGLTGVNISFIHKQPDGIEFIASSLPEHKLQFFKRYELVDSGEAWQVKTPEWEDLALYGELDRTGNSRLGVLLQRSLDGARAEFRSWWWSLLSIFAAITTLALIFAYLFSRGITQPLNQLLLAVTDIARGDYSTPIKVDRRDEIGFLSGAFQKMQVAIGEREDEIQYRADHDLVTHILNRNGFIVRLEDKLEAHPGCPLVVASFRLNHFQDINDALGHSWGDKLLQMVAERVGEKLDGDCLAHFNTDEFALVFDVDTVTSAYALADAIHRCFEQGFSIRGIALSLSVTVGASVFPDSAPDAQGLLRRASVSLNEATERQVSTVVYDPELDQNSVRRLTLMSELPSAIRGGQIQLHFQPKLRCYEDVQIVESAECLVRWTHPELGFVPPDDFIGLAEKTGYIIELTRWVIDQAMAQCARWRRENLDISVAVNISALDLQQADFDQTVNQLLDHHGLPATSLILEVTESAAMQDPDAAISQLAKLEKLGIKLSIDDYGTGYSSLAQLKKLPVHELKIDKSFVLDLSRSDDDKIIVRSTIELGHNIGLSIVAEGVEDNRALWQLANWKCDYVQGFYIAKPMAINEFDQWLVETAFESRKVIASVDRPGIAS